jgi:hypothetical protein
MTLKHEWHEFCCPGGELCYPYSLHAGRSKRVSSSSGNRSGRSAAWLARLVRDQEVDGSNPFAPTTSKPFLLSMFRQSSRL